MRAPRGLPEEDPPELEHEGEMMSKRKGHGARRAVLIPARNEILEFRCGDCATAELRTVKVCGECSDLLCEACVKEHEHGEEMAGPLVHSPRRGVCGYSGEVNMTGKVRGGMRGMAARTARMTRRRARSIGGGERVDPCGGQVGVERTVCMRFRAQV